MFVFNESTSFLQILSTVNITSPIISIILPILFLVIPFVILKFQEYLSRSRVCGYAERYSETTYRKAIVNLNNLTFENCAT
jgi:hypothetical protein